MGFGSFKVEAFSSVRYNQVNPIGLFAQVHFDSSSAAVLHGVMTCFLYNSEQEESDFGRHKTGNITPEINLYFVALREFPAPASYPCNDAEIFQLRRVQIVRQGLNVIRNFSHPISEFLHATL